MTDRIRQAVLQLLFPRRCPVCDRIVKPAGEKICLECIGKLKPLAAPWCMICGKGIMQGETLCKECREGRRHRFRRARALYEYQSAAPSIYRFKYGGRREYGEFFGDEMAAGLGEYIRSVHPDGLIPIPLHKSRLRKRGYNQALLLAKELGKRMNIPVYDKVLLRTQKTAPLKKQNFKERQNNLKKAFLVSENDVKLKTIILIDDIYTTGTTVDEAADALQRAGVSEIYVATLAGGSER